MRVTAPVLACFMVAAAALHFPPLPPWVWLIAGAAGWGAGCVFPGKLSVPLRLFTILSFCMAVVTWRSLPPRHDLSGLIPVRALALDARVEIAGDAVAQDDGFRVPVRVREIRYTPEWTETTARAQLRVDGVMPDGMLPGSRWQVRGRIEPGAAAFTGLRRAGWIYRADTENLTPLPPDGTLSPALWFYRARDSLSRKLAAANAADPEAGDVLQALLLARRGDVDDTWTRRFARTGMIHVFAVSGLHLGILATFLVFVTRQLGISHRWRGLAVFPVLLAFTACTGFRASALRALVMATCLVCAPMLHRRPHPFAAFSLAAVLILGWAPEQIHDIGFQYSFLLVGGLLLFARQFEQALAGWTRGDPWTPTDEQWPWWKTRLARPVLAGLFVSTLSFLLAAPLTARAFHLFSPVALLGNLIAVPLAFVLLATGFPALLLVFLPSEIAAWVCLPARSAARLLLDWVQWVESLPGGVWWTPAPAAWQIVLVYGLPFWFVVLPRYRKPVLAIALVATGFSLTHFVQGMWRAEAVVIDADRGQASWVRNGPRGALLIDAGSDWSGRAVRDTLQARGVNRVPALFLTHPQRNHTRGLRHLLETHAPERIYVAEPDTHHPAYAGLELHPLKAGDAFHLAGWEVEVLWPPAGHRARAMGERSLVLRFSDGFASYLVMGGTNERVETHLLQAEGVRPARLMHAGNSPRAPGCLPEFLQATRVEAVVFSGRGFQGITEAREQSEARVSLAGIPVWRVPQDGLLRFDLRTGTEVE